MAKAMITTARWKDKAGAGSVRNKLLEPSMYSFNRQTSPPFCCWIHRLDTDKKMGENTPDSAPWASCNWRPDSMWCCRPVITLPKPGSLQSCRRPDRPHSGIPDGAVGHHGAKINSSTPGPVAAYPRATPGNLGPRAAEPGRSQFNVGDQAGFLESLLQRGFIAGRMVPFNVAAFGIHNLVTKRAWC